MVEKVKYRRSVLEENRGNYKEIGERGRKTNAILRSLRSLA